MTNCVSERVSSLLGLQQLNFDCGEREKERKKVTNLLVSLFFYIALSFSLFYIPLISFLCIAAAEILEKVKVNKNIGYVIAESVHKKLVPKLNYIISLLIRMIV